MSAITEPKPDYEKEIQRVYRSIIHALPNVPRSEKANIRRAFEFAKEAHEGVNRKSGEPYILHPLAVAKIVVSEMGLQDATSVICAFLHDVVEDTNFELTDIKREFGPKVMAIIDGLTKISEPALLDQMDSKQAENFRKILLTISDDVRVVIIKLADRLHNMRTLGAMRREKMLRNTSETLYIYAPLAHRLGLYEIKTELEELAFKYSNPAIYNEIEAKLKSNQKQAQAYINRFIKGIRKVLKPTGLKFKVKSRFKSIYSIYLKMQRKGLAFEEIYDTYAIRIILETRPDKEREDCWVVYSVISGKYSPNPKRLRDWITVPKDNGYESLHTTLMGPNQQWVEVQIRTTRMDQVAEKGVAAHWKYKEDGELQDETFIQWIAQIRDILENPSLNALEAVREFKEHLAPEDVFVFTPKGEMIRLPNESTVLDFAYKIHTQIGHSAIGAKVNNQVVKLDTRLRPGDQVEILTSRKSHPHKSWLRIVKTARAQENIRGALRRERLDVIKQGKLLFLWRARQYGIDENHEYMKELLAYFFMPNMDEFYYALGSHRINTKRISEFIQLKKEGKEIDNKYLSDWEAQKKRFDERLQEMGVEPDMLILGIDQTIEKQVIAKCCKPLPGDDILGFNQNGKIVIHRTTCEKAISLMSTHSSNIIRAKWATHEAQPNVEFLAAIKVVGLDKQGMLNDLIRIISLQKKLNIRKVTIESQDGMFEGIFHLFVRDTSELQEVMDKVKKLDNVYYSSRYAAEAEGEGLESNPVQEP
ncbi:RelA/SpoT family protein [Pontibacter sp. G13]|uniref:RelA/SpoT family protein n=1 Tax=Pontibacter sp. G13 TaxID=3074898 RepID=UPI0028897A8F|nr:RelA/SpoT family protein [Pontibacter sp. G13]WNJ19747.1 RelA/SpoT family protein [Pontibacter sp. G13]